MKNKRKLLLANSLKNQGFSLVELIISITILVIIFAPLMGNFIQSMKMNIKAEKLQIQSNLASSILEGLKEINMEQTIEQFTGPLADFNVITDAEGHPKAEEIKVVALNASTGLYEEVPPALYPSLPGQATYYFAIHGIEEEGRSFYDALVKINSLPYHPDSSATLNEYPMPDAINLDVMVNGLMFSNGNADMDSYDDEALANYLQWGKAYALRLFEQSSAYLNYLTDYSNWVNECEEALIKEEALPAAPATVTFDPTDYPDYCDITTLKSKITKTMRININQASANTIEYLINYECEWPSGSTLEHSLSYPVYTNHYAKAVDNIYLFFRPSIFTSASDWVEINNATPSNPINFYVAKQAGAPLLPSLTIKKNSLEQIRVFTNIDTLYVDLVEDGVLLANGLNSGIVKTEEKDRLYEVTVKIYEHIATTDISSKYKDELYTLTSTREE